MQKRRPGDDRTICLQIGRLLLARVSGDEVGNQLGVFALEDPGRHPALDPVLDRGRDPLPVRLRRSLAKQVVEVGAYEPVGARAGERVASPAVGLEELLGLLV